MRIAVTGASGYIGAVLVRKMLRIPTWSVVAIDTGWFGDNLPDQGERLTKLRVDVRDIQAGDLSGCDALIHLAAVANDPSAVLNPSLTWEVGAYGTRQVCSAAEAAGVQSLIVASSGSVYGVRPEMHVIETTPLTPVSTYNRVKMVKERIALSFSESMRVVIFRPATVCGVSPRQRLDLSVNTLVMDALQLGRITVLGGDQVRPHLALEDMVEAYLWALQEHNIHGIFNLGFENLTMNELAAIVSVRTGAKIVHEKSTDPRSYRLDATKVREAGFSPCSDVENVIEELIAAYESGNLVRTPETMNVQWMASIGLLDRLHANLGLASSEEGEIWK